jgi:cell division protein FtsQ
MPNKKEKKKKSHMGAWFGIACILLVILTLLSVNITKITITGNKKYTAEQIEKLLFENRKERNSLYVYCQESFRPHKQIPFVESYEIVFHSPVEVEVILYEKSVVGYVSYMSSNMYFDKDGIIVESSSGRLDGIPQVTGLTFGSIVLNKPLPVEDQGIFEHIMNLTQALSANEIKADQIRYDSRGNATLIIGDIDVYLGNNKEMNGKILELCNMLPKLEGMAGTLYLDRYDETSSNLWYSFIKK